MSRDILVTTALPYANGDLHLGHLVEHIQADIWVRFQKMRDNKCYFVCGDDAHGTPIMLLAEKLGITPEELIKQVYARHQQDFKDFQISFDNFYTTHSEENYQLACEIYEKLKAAGKIFTKVIRQAFDPVKNIFLPDRFVKGTCPRCSTPDQYGDNCENCGATYSPLDLKDPISVLSGATPIGKDSEHYFFDLPALEDFLKDWTGAENRLQSSVANKLQEWFKTGLQYWDISRDAPYFGFKIPGTEDKYFYVWLDAPIGYIASFKNFCDKSGENFAHYWHKNSSTELYHFIGKDIVYFHTLFWPAMLKSADYRLPNAVYVHGYLTVNGQKMSKSRGTFIKARTYLNHLAVEYIRYYFAAKLNNTVEDIDLNLADFKARVNADLVGKLINLASRSASFINKHFANQLAIELDNNELFDHFAKQQENIATAYESRDYGQAIRLIMELADQANQYVDQQKPWHLIKDETRKEDVQKICTQILNHFRQLMIYLKPVLPQLAQQAEQFLQVEPMQWHDVSKPLLKHTIQIYQPLLQRIEDEAINAMQQETQNDAQSQQAQATEVTPKKSTADIKAEISIDDFIKVDLRIAKIVSAEAVPEADKLVKLQLDIGEEKPRQVFAGIKASFKPEDLVGRHTVMVANLAPRKMRFGLSEGMVVVASHPEGSQLYLIEPQAGAEPGMQVK